MSEPIVYIDSSEIREGNLEELKKAMNELVEFVEANEPRLIAYNVYFKEDGTRMSVVHVHPDSASLEFHMKMAGPLFPKFAEFIKLLTIDVYGKPNDDLVEQMRQKAQMLGNGTVLVHDLHAGFARFGVR
jgi:quinol monooxygenase YgiN